MQIMPSGGSWTNPAAVSQQALSDAKLAATLKNASHAADPVTPLEQTAKTADRDAQERYDGPQQHENIQSNENASETDSEANSMLILPADDLLDPGTLDVLG